MGFLIAGLDSHLFGGHRHHRYESADDVATILGANYFDDKEAARRMKVGEVVHLVGVYPAAPEHQMAVVTVVDEAVPTVTVAKTIIV